MANINLLPWRLEARERRKRAYIVILAGVFLMTLVFIYAIVYLLESMVNEQKLRNEYLRTEIQFLDTQITEIEDIIEQRKGIERRTDIIFNLQQSRNLPTHILDEIVKIVPPGIYLSSIEKREGVLQIEGRSESNNNVANMMRRVTRSSWLKNPIMQSIVTENESVRQLQRFSLKVSIQGADNNVMSAAKKDMR